MIQKLKYFKTNLSKMWKILRRFFSETLQTVFDELRSSLLDELDRSLVTWLLPPPSGTQVTRAAAGLNVTVDGLKLIDEFGVDGFRTLVSLFQKKFFSLVERDVFVDAIVCESFTLFIFFK